MFSGSIVATVTPFTRDDQVDYAALEKLVEFQIQNGTLGIVPCGTTGESPTLSMEEHARVIAQTVSFVRGRVPVIAGTGSNCTREAIELSKGAEKCGANALLLVNPYYNKPSQEGLYRHFKAVAECSKLPIVLYNIPGRTGVTLNLETIYRLAEISNFQAIKDATGGLDFVTPVLTNTDMTVLSGDDALTLPMMACGAKGVISVVANAVPRQMADLTAAALRGDFTEARRMHDFLHPLFKASFVETNPVPVKTLLGLMGRLEDNFRLPLAPLADASLKVLKDAAKACALIS